MYLFQAVTYKQDFMDERRDREKAKGDLEALQREKEEKDNEIAGLKQELADHKDQMAKIARERDDFKNEAERRKTSKHHKIKDYNRMKEEVR